MPELKYKGAANFERSLSKKDFTDHGVEDQGAVKWNKGNDFKAEVSDAAWEWMQTEESGLNVEFELVTDEAAPADADSDDTSAEDSDDTSAEEISTSGTAATATDESPASDRPSGRRR